MTTVQATTDTVPELAAVLARRREQGLDTYDEWWQGVYRIVTGPTPEHGRIVVRIAALLDELAEGTDLSVSAPVNIGRDKDDARVPDIGVFHDATPRTSQAHLATAQLVVEVLSHDETAGAKLAFHADWVVQEYLEVDLRQRGLRLMARTVDGWQTVTASGVLPFSIDGDALVAAHRQYAVDWPPIATS